MAALGLGFILFAVGVIVLAIGSIWFLAVAFQENLLWGFGCLLFPPAGLSFLALHFDVASKPFYVQLASIPPIVLGVILMQPSF